MEGGGVRDNVQLATKFGIVSYEGDKMGARGDPAYVRAACEANLKRLQVDCTNLYYQHRIDTTFAIEVTVSELKKLVEEGKIKCIGLSEASAATIRIPHAVHPITAVQLEWSLWSRYVEEDIVPVCRELGIGIVAYSSLGRGSAIEHCQVRGGETMYQDRHPHPRHRPKRSAHRRRLSHLE